MQALFALVLCVQAYLALSDCSPNPCSTSETCCPAAFPFFFSCCPAPNAVCCSDGLHCCPTNTVCNLDKGTCENKTSQLIPFLFRKREDLLDNTVKAVVMKEARKVKVVYCPDGLSYCPDSTTCCELTSGQFACCPHPSAVCCMDGIHCCPYGTKCDYTSSKCLQKDSYWWAVAPKRQRTPAVLLK